MAAKGGAAGLESPGEFSGSNVLSITGRSSDNVGKPSRALHNITPEMPTTTKTSSTRRGAVATSCSHGIPTAGAVRHASPSGLPGRPVPP